VADTQMMTIKEVAYALSCTSKHVREMIDCGKIPAIDIGVGTKKVWRVPEEGLSQLLAEVCSNKSGAA
jgi:excisionase family DNA binding protein